MIPTSYLKGSHIVATFQNGSLEQLSNAVAFKHLVDKLIEQLNLAKVGEVYHEFDSGGFTAVVCLTESHLSIHTWPEFGIATFDVFLSNFQHDNTERTTTIFQAVQAYFEQSTVTDFYQLKR